MRRLAWVVAAMALLGAACRQDSVTLTTHATSTPTPAVTTAVVTVAPTTLTTLPTTAQVPATSATSAPDVDPPALIVNDPESGATVATGVYRFAGTTEPGCTVTAAGRYEADVDADGSWSILLVLNRGSNVATFLAADAAGNTTEARVPVYYEPPLSSPDRWVGRTVSWARSGIGPWAEVKGEYGLWEQNSGPLGLDASVHLVSLTAPTDRDIAISRESLIWIVSGGVIRASQYVELDPGREITLCQADDASLGSDRIVGLAIPSTDPAQPQAAWRADPVTNTITVFPVAGVVCEL